MVKIMIPAIALIFLLGSCSSLKQLGFSNNKQSTTTSLTPALNPPTVKTNDVKFLDNISANSQASVTETPAPETKLQTTTEVAVQKGPEHNTVLSSNSVEIENVSALQMKYALLLNIEASQIENLKLFEFIDDWYGTRYCMGGTTKNCIDCSAFVQAFFSVVYGITLPRTSKEQYTATQRISTTELKEGDLLFFHTRHNRRGVTHVGIYLQNNKFVHASSSGGVKISDMYEPYYVQHLIGAGRAEK